MGNAGRRYVHPVGVSLGDMTPPEKLGEKARWLEQLGYSHLMVPEDYFYVPALVGATLALSATETVPVGTSIVSGLVRSPAVLAMEIAGISRTFPARFHPGIGLGLPAWLQQMGILPEKPVTALRESVTSLQRLLAGVDFFRWAMAQVEKGLAAAGRSSDAMAYSTVALTLVDRDGDRARAAARPILASFLGEFGVNTLTDAYGISEQVTEILERGGPEAMEAEMPGEWLEDLTLVGTPAEVVEKIRRWLAAGIDSICVFLPDEERERATFELVAADVIPALA